MKVERFDDPHAFCDRVLPLLLRHEAENNLMISVALRLADGTGTWGDAPPVLYAVEDAGQMIAAALQTPPHYLQLTRMGEDALACLVDALRAGNHALPGVLGPVGVVETFAKRWADGRELQAQVEKGMGIYQLERVVPPAHPGGLQALATEDDIPLLLEWLRDFFHDTGLPEQENEALIRKALSDERFFLWQAPAPVSLAACCGPTPHGMRINSVYTPPEQRGKGYASANVAALSQHLLDNGCLFCYLFTDLDNPTSNSIYQKIGYRRVCEFTSVRFTDVQG